MVKVAVAKVVEFNFEDDVVRFDIEALSEAKVY